MATTSIYVSPESLVTGEPLPAGVRPSRASASINFVVPLHSDAGIALLLHDVDPIKYRTWYPPFHFTDWPLAKVPADYDDLRRVLFSELPTDALPEKHLPAASKFLRDLLGCGLPSIVPLGDDETWLKFSPSKDIWTAYRFSYFLVPGLEKGDTKIASEFVVGFLPLNSESIKAVLATGMFKEKPLVDNLVKLLSSPIAVRALTEAGRTNDVS